MIVTSNDRPVTLLTNVKVGSVEVSLAAWRLVRASQAVNIMQQQSFQQHNDTISLDEINQEIHAVRADS